METQNRKPATTYANWIFSSALLVAGLAFAGGPAAADHLIQSPTYSHPTTIVSSNYDRNSNYSNFPLRWHIGRHDEDPLWYHRNVAPDHGFLPSRFHGMPHRFDSFAEYRRFQGQGRLVSSVGPVSTVPHHVERTQHATPAPRRSCSGINVGTLLGAAIGGFAGSQFGGGSGKLAATAAGTLFGAAVGSGAGCR